MTDRSGQRNKGHYHRAGADRDFQIISKNKRENGQHEDTAAAGKAAYPADTAAEQHCKNRFPVGWRRAGSGVPAAGDRLEQKTSRRGKQSSALRYIPALLNEQNAMFKNDDNDN